MLTSDERRLRAQKAIHTRLAHSDATEMTASARAAFLRRFEEEIDAGLPPDERRRRAEHALKAHMAGLALKSSRARSAKRSNT